MTESNLSLTFSKIAAKVGHFLNWTSDATKWDGDYTTVNTKKYHIQEIIDSGYRKFLYPRGPDGGLLHQWSFLRATTTLSLMAPYTTGTVSSVSTTVTVTGGTFPYTLWGGATAIGTFYITVDGTTHEVSAIAADGLTLTLTAAPTTAFDADTYSLQVLEYDAPDTFGFLRGPMYYSPDKSDIMIEKIPAPKILHQRASQDINGYPLYCATRPKAVSAGSTGQRTEFLFYPNPSEAFTVYYNYEVYPTKISTSSEYPLGGMAFSECILESCLAVAEQRFKGGPGVHTAMFQQELMACVEQDGASVADYAGRVTSGEDGPVLRRSDLRITVEETVL